MRRAFSTVVLLALVSASGGPAIAQQQGVVLRQQQQADISVPGRGTVAIVVDFQPGGTTGRHTHPGEMVGYVLSGSVLLDQDGAAPRVLNGGEIFIIPAGVIHSHTNRGTAVARMLATYIVDKSRALTSPIPTAAR